MIGINQMTVLGNVGTKPELKYGSNGTAVTNLSIATTDTWLDKQTNEKRESTEWHRVSLFGKLAEIACQHVDKGSKVYVQGKLKTRSYDDKDGVKRYITEIVISGYSGVFQMLDKVNNSHVVVSPVVGDDATDLPF